MSLPPSPGRAGSEVHSPWRLRATFTQQLQVLGILKDAMEVLTGECSALETRGSNPQQSWVVMFANSSTRGAQQSLAMKWEG